ncbi:MAG: hypothetical protein ACOCUR_02165 [Nanoarchaeota archaeon]
MNEGLTDKEIKQALDLKVKANLEQLIKLSHEFNVEISDRFDKM